MRRIMLLAVGVVAAFRVGAQEFPTDNNFVNSDNQAVSLHRLSDPAYDWAVGAQFSDPFYALSVKYAATDHSVFQLMVSPVSAMYGHYGYSFYGARYIYRFPFNVLPFYGVNTASYPYLFGGAGVLSLSFPVNNAAGAYDHNNHVADLGWSAGLGYEFVFGKHWGLSFEAGYGALTASGASTTTGFTYSTGLHYYFCTCSHHAPKADNADPDDTHAEEQVQEPEMEQDQPQDDDKPVHKRKRWFQRPVDDGAE